MTTFSTGLLANEQLCGSETQKRVGRLASGLDSARCKPRGPENVMQSPWDSCSHLQQEINVNQIICSEVGHIQSPNMIF